MTGVSVRMIAAALLPGSARISVRSLSRMRFTASLLGLISGSLPW